MAIRMELRSMAQRMIAAHGYEGAVRQAREARRVMEDLEGELGHELAYACLAASRLVLAIHAVHRQEVGRADH